MRAFLLVAALVCVFQSAFGFVPPMKAVRRDVRMMAQFEGPKLDNTAKSVLAGLTPAVIAAPVLATEGTGEIFGIDDARIPILVATIGIAFGFLFSTWSGRQDNDEFFDEFQR